MAEDSVRVVQNTAQGTDKAIRNLSVTTNINGVPTTVDMQVTVLSDDQGNLITDLASGAAVRDAAAAIVAAVLQAITACDTNNVQVSGGTIAISSLPTVQAVLVGAAGPIPVTPALPPNAAQESGGNLDAVRASNQDSQQMFSELVNVMKTVLAQLNAMAEQQGVRVVTYPQ